MLDFQCLVSKKNIRAFQRDTSWLWVPTCLNHHNFHLNLLNYFLTRLNTFQSHDARNLQILRSFQQDQTDLWRCFWLHKSSKNFGHRKMNPELKKSSKYHFFLNKVTASIHIFFMKQTILAEIEKSTFPGLFLLPGRV